MDKQSIRPELNLNTKDASIEETFQNEVLRPIIKLQHELIICNFKHFIETMKIDFQSLKKEAQLKFIKDSLTKDLSLNNYFKGLISGLFTKEEFIFYLEHKQTINKRIIQIIENRIVDSISELKK